jgi:hypothetical protein
MTGKSRGEVDGENPVYIFKRASGVIEGTIQISRVIEWLKVLMQMVGGMLVLMKSGLVKAV